MGSTTRKLGLPYPDLTDGPDGANVPYWMEGLARRLDAATVGYDQGPLSSRPDPQYPGRLYYATDVATLFLDTGTAWVVNGYQPGDLRYTARGLVEIGWLVCDGSPVSRTTYANLFDALRTTFGAGDGRTTFNLPDLRDRVAVGVSATKVRGATGGEERHTLTEAEMPSHTHAVSDPGHRHGPGSGGSFATNSAVNPMPYGGYYGGAVGSDTLTTLNGTGISIVRAGSSSSHNNMQPYVTVNVWIKT
jgi:microcystin-dependent protein